MAMLTATESARLGNVRPELYDALLTLKDMAAAQLGFALTIPEHGGVRSNAEQAALYADALAAGGGVDTAYAVARPGRSRHEYGAAFDVNIIGGGSAGGAGSDADYRQLATLGESIGLVAGYNFAARGVGKKDPYHFQLDESLATSIALWGATELGANITPTDLTAFVVVAIVVVLVLIMRKR